MKRNPSITRVLRMCTAPPLARDRLVGLTYTTKNFVVSLEKGIIPSQMKDSRVEEYLEKVNKTIRLMLDTGVLPWLEGKNPPDSRTLERSAMIIADRLCGALSDPIIRNAQEKRQLQKIKAFLDGLGYQEETPVKGSNPQDMRAGTYCVHHIVKAQMDDSTDEMVLIPIDVSIKRRKAAPDEMPILIEAKAAGDYTNTNKRRKEESAKIQQIRRTFGKDTAFILFLCGYFDSTYLGYEAAAGIDWVWEHRIEDLKKVEL